MTASLLQIEDLRVQVDGKPILNGFSLEVSEGEIHALMGPNGAGKSTLAYAVLGHPRYQVTGGRIRFRGEDVTKAPCDERARRGLFLGFQHPVTVPGVSIANFLLTAVRAAGRSSDGKEPTVKEFRRRLKEKMALLGIADGFLVRPVNDGFSGGEKKKLEILQMLVLSPVMAILDETDSGLDIDALRTVSNGINAHAGPGVGILLVTHYQRLLNFVKPHRVHVLVDGRVVRSGGADLALELEARGYEGETKAA